MGNFCKFYSIKMYLVKSTLKGNSHTEWKRMVLLFVLWALVKAKDIQIYRRRRRNKKVNWSSSVLGD